ncbi:hypothetical protein EV360DRAFT_76560 [Lentinula raphanica]|nr:hypothetical protein EV360DRAFT_76560 [Lentinula raphanica]
MPYYEAAVCNKLAADSVWHQLNDGLYDAAQTALLYQEDLPRSTAPAELRSITQTNDFKHYKLLRDMARTNWAQIHESYLEKELRPALPNTYNPNRDFDEEEDFAGDNNGDFGYPENNDEEGVEEEDGEGVEEEDGEGTYEEDIEEDKEVDEEVDENEEGSKEGEGTNKAGQLP